MDTKENAITLLKKMVIGQKSAALPQIDALHPLWALHQQLSDYDRFVTETVVRTLAGKKTYPSYPDKEQLQQALIDAETPQDYAALLPAFRRYQQRLDEMIDLAAQVIADMQ